MVLRSGDMQFDEFSFYLYFASIVMFGKLLNIFILDDSAQ